MSRLLEAMGRFSDDEQSRLRELGVIDEQVQQLRFAQLAIRVAIAPHAARNDALQLLEDIRKLSVELDRKLGVLLLPPTAGHSLVHALLEERYWRIADRQADDGPTLSEHLMPRLRALSASASHSIDSLPKQATRHRTGDPTPIRRIDEALLWGWVKAHGPVAGAWASFDNEADEIAAMIEHAQAQRPAKPYPAEFRPSVSASSAFREIVEICYSAAGYKAFPKRALEAYVSEKNRQRRELSAAIEDGVRQGGD